MKTRLLCVALLLLIATSVTAHVGPGVVSTDVRLHTLYVDASVTASGDGLSWVGAYKTIVEGVAGLNALASIGSELLIAPGFYVEKDGIEITANDVSIRGFGLPEETVLFGSGVAGSVQEGVADCLTISSGNVHISGLSIFENSTSYSALVFAGEGGGYNGGFNVIENCYFPIEVAFDRPKYAIEFEAGAGNIIRNCLFEGCGTAAIHFGSTASNHPVRNSILSCTFRGTQIGININAHAYSTIIDQCIFLSGDQSSDSMTNAIVGTAACNGDILVSRCIFEQAAADDIIAGGSATWIARDNTDGG